MATLSHQTARNTLEQAFARVLGRAPTNRELLYTQAVAWLETNYGRAGQFGTLANQGLFNWGGEQTRPDQAGVCPVGTAPGGDTDGGKPVSVCFYVSNSDDDAAERFVRTLVKAYPERAKAILAAMATGTSGDVAHAMRVQAPYYTASESSYADALSRALTVVIQGLGLTPFNNQPSKPPQSASELGKIVLVPWLVLTGLVSVAGLGAYALYRRSRA